MSSTSDKTEHLHDDAGNKRHKKHKRDDWVKPFFKQYRGALTLALFLGVLTFSFSSALMFNSGYLISKAAEAPGNIMIIFVPVALARIFGVGKPILHYLERLTSHDWVLRMTSSLRLKLYNVLEKDAIFLKQRIKTGDVLGLLAEDIGHVQNLYLRCIFPLVIAYVLYALVIILLGLFSLWFALYMLLLLGVVVVLVPLVSMLVNGARQKRRKSMKNELYEHLTDDVLGVSDWIIAGRGHEYTQIHRDSEEALRAVDAKLNTSSRIRDLILQVVYSVIAVSLLVWAGSYFGGTYAGPANWIAAFVLGFFPLIDAFSPLSQASIEIHKYRDSVDNLNELSQQEDTLRSTFKENAENARVRTLDSTEAISAADEPTGSASDKLSAPYLITLNQTVFAYPHTERNVLDGLNLTIEPGEKLAILGRSGAGKSTLASLIRGDLVPTQGSVTMNGTPTCTMGDDITNYIGVIQQQTYLFNATLAENLRIGNQAASDDELWETLEKVGLGPMVRRLPDGLDTLVDEAGLRFSGGERHRIALARVLLHHVPIIILDEPTVGLDPLSEQALLDTLFATLQDKTIIMITHHLQGVSLMDRVVFVEDGTLKIDGSPQELAKTNSYYQKLQAFDKGIYA